MAVSLFIVFLAVLLTLVLITAVYFLLYKRRINRTLLTGSTAGRAMSPPHTILVLASLALLILAVVVSYFIGYKTAYDRMESAGPSALPETFYAEILRITGTQEEGNAMQIQGSCENDARYRGLFSLSVYGETAIEWQGAPLAMEQLEPGDRIAVTFSGEISPSAPAVLEHVVRIQLLDDAL